MKVYYNSKLAKRLLFGNFKTCMFGGFDRGDVINYIEKSAKEAKERIEALENENNELRSNNERIEQALRALHAQAKQQRQEEQGQEALQQQLSEAQVHLNELAVEIDTLRAENEMLRAEAQSLRTESVKLREAADDYAHLKEHIADIEINAHRRTEEFRAEAIEKLRQSVAAQRTWCQGQRGQYTQMNEKLLQELRRAEEVIANNDLSGFDAMLESLQALEDTLQ